MTQQTAAIASPGTSLWVLVFLSAAQLIIALDFNVVYVALPQIGRALDFNPHTLQWVVSAYAVALGGFLLVGGRAADLLGRRRIFITALGCYAVASLIGGMSSNAWTIIGARALQGIGGAFLFPATLALINTIFEEGPKRNRALAVWGAAGSAGLTVGSLLGGVLTEVYGWPAVFFVNVPAAVLVAAGALLTIPRDTSEHKARDFDLAGGMLISGAASLIVLALALGPDRGWTSPAVWGALVIGVALSVTFHQVEKRTTDPIIPLHLFRYRNLRLATAITALFMASFGALPYFQTVLFQQGMGFSVFETGLAFLPPAIATAIGGPLGARIATAYGTRAALVAGLLTGGAGMGSLALVSGQGASYWEILAPLIFVGSGQGIVWTGMWIAAASGVSSDEQGVASGIAATTQQIGGAIGLASLIALASFFAGDFSEVFGVFAGSRAAFYSAAAMTLITLLFAMALRIEKN